MTPKSDNIIIIKKIKKGGHGHHGGSWKVAYADFVTAMMALFIVLWVLAQSEKTKEAVAIYFTEPELTPEEIKVKLEHPALPSSAVKIEPSKDPKVKYKDRNQESETLEKLAKRIQKDLEKLKWFKSMKGQLLIEMTPEGLRIEFLDNARAPFFDVGSPSPRNYTVEALTAITKELGRVPNPVVLEGHTDSRPFRSGIGYSNWELSSDRANAARRVLEVAGIPRGRIQEVRGLADVRLRVPARPFDDSNRRISVVVRYMTQAPTQKVKLGEPLPPAEPPAQAPEPPAHAAPAPAEAPAHAEAPAAHTGH